MNALFDTNILIDYLNGEEAAKREFELFDKHFISPITWMEVMVGVPDEKTEAVKGFLAAFQSVDIDETVCTQAISIRKEKRIKLPDAIIEASAQTINAILVTRNSKDFSVHEPFVRIPYTL